MSLSVVGTVGALAFTKGGLARIYPWGLPAKVAGSLMGRAFHWDAGAASIAGPTWVACAVAAAIVVAGGLLLVRRDVP